MADVIELGLVGAASVYDPLPSNLDDKDGSSNRVRQTASLVVAAR